MVVNGALALAATRRRFREQGESEEDVTRRIALRRFRPLFLTALTTFPGLTLTIFTTSVQALFCVPQATSLDIGTPNPSFVSLIPIPEAAVMREEDEKRFRPAALLVEIVVAS